jgi:NTE family protein
MQRAPRATVSVPAVSLGFRIWWKVLSQTFRSLIHSRLELGMKGYEHSHPRTDVLLFEPDRRDPQLFLANLFSYGQRQRLAEHAYQRTRADLRSRRSVLRTQLSSHGLGIRDAVLDDSARTLVRRRPPSGRRSALALRRLDEVLDDLERALVLQTPKKRLQAR